MSKIALSRRQALAVLGLTAVGCGRSRVDPTKDAVTDPVEQLSPTGADPEVLQVGITPSLGEGTSDKLSPLYDYLAQKLGKKVVGHTAKSYDDLAVMVRDQKVDLGVFSPAAYVTARPKMSAVAIATATRNGSPTYLGYLIVKRGAYEHRPLLKDLKDKRIAWVSNSSTSGYFYPRRMLRQKGFDPDHFFKDATFAGSHDKAIEMVSKGEVDVAAAASPFVDRETYTSAEHAPEVMVVAKTERIPLDCLVVHTRIQRELGTKLRAALHDMVKSSPETSLALDHSWGIDGFTKPMHKLYNNVEANIGETS